MENKVNDQRFVIEDETIARLKKKWENEKRKYIKEQLIAKKRTEYYKKQIIRGIGQLSLNEIAELKKDKNPLPIKKNVPPKKIESSKNKQSAKSAEAKIPDKKSEKPKAKPKINPKRCNYNLQCDHSA